MHFRQKCAQIRLGQYLIWIYQPLIRVIYIPKMGAPVVVIIMPGIVSLSQYITILSDSPDVLKPEQCPGCGKAGSLTANGCYHRKADHEHVGSQSRNPIPILRFYCPLCRITCSVLPECIPPRRHYEWSIQQAVIEQCVQGSSFRAVAKQSRPSRWTIGRWLRRLSARFLAHATELRNKLPQLGYC